MSHHQSLQWVQKNRSGVRDRARRAGESITRCVEHTIDSGVEPARRVAAALATLVDDDFRGHCRIVCGPNGTIAVNVDVPALVQPMRMRWLNPLRIALKGAAAQWRADRLVFAYGTVGVGLPAAAEIDGMKMGPRDKTARGGRRGRRDEADG